VNFEVAIERLCDAGVRFVVIGGWAAIFHGSAHVTNDLDICYSRDKENRRKLTEPHKAIRLTKFSGATPLMILLVIKTAFGKMRCFFALLWVRFAKCAVSSPLPASQVPTPITQTETLAPFRHGQRGQPALAMPRVWTEQPPLPPPSAVSGRATEVL
jgi:hypothetical protein